MAFVNEVSEKIGESRTIDYERGAVLTEATVENLGYYRIPDEYPFCIIWKEKKIEFLAVQKIEVFKEDGSDGRVTYYVNKCYYPEELRPYKKEIIQLVVDGLMAYGVSYGAREGTEIVVRISPSLGNLQMEPIPEMPL